MLNFLSIELARRNPAAYSAHFRRLEAVAQASYLAGLGPEALKAHLAAVGAALTVGLLLTLREGPPTLAARVAGKALGPVSGWDEARVAQGEALALAATLGVPVVTGLLDLSTEALSSVDRLSDLGWRVEQVSLCLDEEHQRLEWAVSGSLAGGGSFWSARQGLPLDRAPECRTRLEAAAAQVQARFELTRL